MIAREGDDLGGALALPPAAASTGPATSDPSRVHPDLLRQELSLLWSGVLELAFATERLVADALDAVRERDVAQARSVLSAEGALDRRARELRDHVSVLLARYHPVARDLRLVTASVKISRDLREIARRSARIARSVEEIAAEAAPLPTEAEEMGRLAQAMLRSALDDFTRWDGEHARAVLREDERVDYLHSYLFQNLLARMREDSRRIGACLALMRVGREIERIADLATNVAEGVIYLVDGELVRRRRAE